MVARAIGADVWNRHDDGSESSLVDFVLHCGSNSIALEVTSHPDPDWLAASALMQELGVVQPLQRLDHDWVISFETSHSHRQFVDAASKLVSLYESQLLHLSRSEAEPSIGLVHLPDDFDHLGVRACYDFGATEHPDGGYLYFAHGKIGTGAWATDDIRSVLSDKEDNQKKLRMHDANERHLFVHVELSGDTLDQSYLGREECPADAHGVIDTLWVYSVWDSAWLYRLSPGTRLWTRYECATGKENSVQGTHSE